MYSICVEVAIDEMKHSFSGSRTMNFYMYATLLVLLVATFLSGKFNKTFYIKHLHVISLITLSLCDSFKKHKKAVYEIPLVSTPSFILFR